MTMTLLLAVEVLIMVTPVTLCFTPPAFMTFSRVSKHQGTITDSSQLYQLTPGGRADMDMVFGSEQGSTSKSDGGVYDEDMDDDQLDRLKRRETVQALLEEQELEFRADRKRQQWGKFANITNKEELEPLLQEELQKVEQGRVVLCIEDVKALEKELVLVEC
jgi:hypothetical protein